MKVLVIGNKGFIGSHVFNFYAALPATEAWGCDVVTDYTSLNYFLVDATNADYDDVFSAVKFDLCINCSGASSVPDSFVHPQRDFKLNVQNVVGIVDAIRKHAPACKFLNLSSAAVYGNPASLPVAESASLRPLSPYGRHKLFAEEICQEYFTHFGIRTSSARIFSAYGMGLKKQLFWDWHKRLAECDHLEILGTGRESRDFIFAEDIVKALHCIATNSPFMGEAINVGNGSEIFIAEAISCFQKHYPKHFTYSFTGNTRAGDPTNWRAENSWLRTNGFQSEISFEEGIKRYIQWAVRV